MNHKSYSKALIYNFFGYISIKNTNLIIVK